MYFTIRNTAILALVQIGVIVAGVLGAGACHKWYTTFGLRTPAATALVCEYGFVALVLPVVWIVVALEALRREDAEEFRVAAFCAGILLLVLLVVGVIHTAAQPLLRLLVGC